MRPEVTVDSRRSTNSSSSRPHAQASVILNVQRQMWNAPMFAHTNRTCCWPAPTIHLQSRNAITNENRSATVERISAAVAHTSVQKKPTHPLGSSTSTTRIPPPTGRHIATNVL
jgi:hypothetical protein